MVQKDDKKRKDRGDDSTMIRKQVFRPGFINPFSEPFCNFKDDCLSKKQIIDEKSPPTTFCRHCVKNGRLMKRMHGQWCIMDYIGDFHEPLMLPY